MPELRGSRCLLRPLRPDDYEAWRDVRHASRRWLETWEPLPEAGVADPADDLEAFRARCAAWERQRHLDTAYGFGIFLADDARFVGEVSLGTVHRGPFQTAYLGYWIGEQHAGKGLVPEAVALVLGFAFAELRLHRVEAAVVPRNRASIRVVEKLGLRYEGLAERFLQIRGVWEDHARYAITAEEWAERRAQLERSPRARR